MNCLDQAILPKLGKNLYGDKANKKSRAGEKMNGKRFLPYERRSVIKCECGFEIPVIADVEAVGRAIDEHIDEHRRKQQDPVKGEVAAKQAHDYLFKRLFDKISQMCI